MENNINEAIINEAKKKLKNGEIKNNADLENFIDNLIQPLYQNMLDTELENMLDYSKYERKQDKNNSRNGYCKSKKVQTKYGKFEEIVLSLCAKGMSYRDISSMLKEIYGVAISKDQILKFTNTISEVVDNWRSRPLKAFYAFIYADCLYIPVMDDLRSEKKAFYVIIGIDSKGLKDVLGIWCDKTESASFWTNVFEDLKARGVQDILYATSDGIAGFKGSLETAFPKTNAQRCVVHLPRNLYKICPKKDASKIIKGFLV